MADFLVVGIMLAAAVVPFVGMTVLMIRQWYGPALTVAALLGALLVLLIFATSRPVGIDPVFAMTLAMIGAVPAFIGAAAGAMLGWMIIRRRTKGKIR